MANDNEWIEWNGGECPIQSDAMIDIKTRQGLEYHGFAARSLDWQHFDDSFYSRSDIIAYRVSQ